MHLKNLFDHPLGVTMRIRILKSWKGFIIKKPSLAQNYLATESFSLGVKYLKYLISYEILIQQGTL